MNRFDLSGRAAVVTGGAGGLGRAMAEVLAEAGARVAILDIDGAAAAETAQAIGGGAVARALDAGDRDAVRAAITRVAADFGRLDIAIANAGISAGPGFGTSQGRLAAVEDATWDRVLAVNLTGVFATVQAAAGVMSPRRRGSIIAVASVAGLKAEPMVGYAYAATKAAVVNLVRQAAAELAPQGVRVNGIAPGPIRTNIGGGRLGDPEVEAGFRGAVPMGRIGEPDEIKGLALLLASDASSFITGVTIPVDGGIMAG